MNKLAQSISFSNKTPSSMVDPFPFAFSSNKKNHEPIDDDIVITDEVPEIEMGLVDLPQKTNIIHEVEEFEPIAIVTDVNDDDFTESKIGEDEDEDGSFEFLENSSIDFDDKSESEIDETLDNVINNTSDVVDDVLSDDAKSANYSFKLDVVPGADSDDEIIDEEAEQAAAEKENSERDKKTPKDEWDWENAGGLPKFLTWLQERFSNIPKHSGTDTTGIERVLAYFQRLDSEISKAMRKDYKREIDATKAEEARAELHDGIERLVARLEKLQSKKFKKNVKRSSIDENGITKQADTATTGKIIVNVPYLISNIARTCIESTVQGGKNIEEVFEHLSKEYDLDKREQSQVLQLIKDMGYPIILDRANPFKPISPSATSGKISEFQPNYYS